MSHKEKKSKYHEYFVNYKNTPHLKEKTKIIGMCYLFSGINLLVFGVFSSEKAITALQKNSILLGVIMLLMVPVSKLDKRRENRGTMAVLGTCIIHLVICITLSYVSSPLWMIVYASEIVLCCGVIIASTLPKNRNTKVTAKK